MVFLQFGRKNKQKYQNRKLVLFLDASLNFHYLNSSMHQLSIFIS
jgi:hypothetical protein